MKLILAGILLLKLSTDLTFSKAEDDQFRKLENKECGEYYQTHRNLEIAMFLCRQRKRCMGVEVFRCDEKLSTIRLCEYGFGYKDSFRTGSCVYDKKVKLASTLPASETSTTTSNTPSVFSSEANTSQSIQTESVVSNISSIAPNLTSPSPTITLSGEKLSTSQSIKNESTNPQSTLMVYHNRNLTVTAINDDRLVDGEKEMTLSCLTDENWKTCIWLYDRRVCKLEYSFNESSVGIKWTYEEVFCDPEFGNYTFMTPKDYEYGNVNKECTIRLARVTFEGQYKCKFQRCNPEDNDLCKTKISDESPMFEDAISVKIRKNKPKVEDPDQEESGGCKLNAKEEIFSMISISTAQILLSLLAV